MPRPKGSRNHDHEETRRSILRLLQQRLLSVGGATASFRELAASAGLNPATLRHYFKTREELLQAVFTALREVGERYISEGATADRGGVRASLRWFLEYFQGGWSRGLGPMHTLGLTAGLVDPKVGASYLNEVLDPTLQSAEARIALHVAKGELLPCDLRHAALELVTPFMFALLHQHGLEGSRCRPLALDRFLDDHVERFLRAYAVDGGRPVPRSRTRRRRAPSVKKKGARGVKVPRK
ncbi:TetR/AcrR family transcriptional regulator [Myxococcus sp. RHSTA-1-4]|uniref:TetR/AcrR family transcriptional regulator n=1 Tax=Myxococcus sp. RHSTA-1-4 TaxID=2874601 RepID=UPI001CBE8AE5|nr:TetR/AcrR family transcriptional regulator [Myxococcus sp. RHSTA-1-4]MBZ4419174.1 TetR/AcrR family transcriptional regulator [Myxococcus sp. RHSTA-1-4]